MRLTKEVCMECTGAEKVTAPGGGNSAKPCPWRIGVMGTDDDDELWAQGRVTCPNSGTHDTNEIPPDCLRRRKQRAFFEMAVWIADEVPG